MDLLPLSELRSRMIGALHERRPATQWSASECEGCAQRVDQALATLGEADMLDRLLIPDDPIIVGNARLEAALAMSEAQRVERGLPPDEKGVRALGPRDIAVIDALEGVEVGWLQADGDGGAVMRKTTCQSKKFEIPRCPLDAVRSTWGAASIMDLARRAAASTGMSVVDVIWWPAVDDVPECIGVLAAAYQSVPLKQAAG